VPDHEGKITVGTDKSFTKNGGLAEHIIYFKKSAGLFGRPRAFLQWNKLLKRTINKYIEEHGKPGIVHVHVPLKAGLIARWIKKRYDVPYVASEHSAHYNMGSHDDFFDRSFIYRKEVAAVFKKATAVTNVSSAMGNVLKGLFNLTNVYTINNTVDTSLFNYEASSNRKFRFIHVSTLTESQKNLTGILGAIQKLSKGRQDFEFTIVGPASKELKGLIHSEGLENFVTLTGEISYADVSKQMKQASALVLFSRYENLPCVIIEALCCGLPVIATDVGGVNELVNENNGMLVRSEDEDGLLEKMNYMMNDYGNYDKERIAMSAQEKFSYSTIGKQFHKLYSEVSR
jgi:glycosyltransferase involved in cell wall biosynthesis